MIRDSRHVPHPPPLPGTAVAATAPSSSYLDRNFKLLEVPGIVSSVSPNGNSNGNSSQQAKRREVSPLVPLVPLVPTFDVPDPRQPPTEYAHMAATKAVEASPLIQSERQPLSLLNLLSEIPDLSVFHRAFVAEAKAHNGVHRSALLAPAIPAGPPRRASVMDGSLSYLESSFKQTGMSMSSSRRQQPPQLHSPRILDNSPRSQRRPVAVSGPNSLLKALSTHDDASGAAQQRPNTTEERLLPTHHESELGIPQDAFVKLMLRHCKGIGGGGTDDRLLQGDPAPYAPPATVAALQHMFRDVDRDGDGFVSWNNVYTFTFDSGQAALDLELATMDSHGASKFSLSKQLWRPDNIYYCKYLPCTNPKAAILNAKQHQHETDVASGGKMAAFAPSSPKTSADAVKAAKLRLENLVTESVSLDAHQPTLGESMSTNFDSNHRERLASKTTRSRGGSLRGKSPNGYNYLSSSIFDSPPQSLGDFGDGGGDASAGSNRQQQRLVRQLKRLANRRVHLLMRLSISSTPAATAALKQETIHAERNTRYGTVGRVSGLFDDAGYSRIYGDPSSEDSPILDEVEGKSGEEDNDQNGEDDARIGISRVSSSGEEESNSHPAQREIDILRSKSDVAHRGTLSPSTFIGSRASRSQGGSRLAGRTNSVSPKPLSATSSSLCGPHHRHDAAHPKGDLGDAVTSLAARGHTDQAAPLPFFKQSCFSKSTPNVRRSRAEKVARLFARSRRQELALLVNHGHRRGRRRTPSESNISGSTSTVQAFVHSTTPQSNSGTSSNACRERILVCSRHSPLQLLDAKTLRPVASFDAFLHPVRSTTVSKNGSEGNTRNAYFHNHEAIYGGSTDNQLSLGAGYDPSSPSGGTPRSNSSSHVYTRVGNKALNTSAANSRSTSEYFRFPDDSTRIVCADYLPAISTLVAFATDMKLRAWVYDDTRVDMPILRPLLCEFYVTCMRAAPWSPFTAPAANLGLDEGFSAATQQPPRLDEGPSVTSSSSLSSLLFTGDRGGKIALYEINAKTLNEPRAVDGFFLHKAQSGGVSCFCFAVDGREGIRGAEATAAPLSLIPVKRIVSAGMDNDLILTDITTRKSTVIANTPCVIKMMEFVASIHSVVAVGIDNSVGLWVIHQSRRPCTPLIDNVDPHMALIIGLEVPSCTTNLFSPEGIHGSDSSNSALSTNHHVITTDQAGMVKVWDVRTYRCVQTWRVGRGGEDEGKAHHSHSSSKGGGAATKASVMANAGSSMLSGGSGDGHVGACEKDVEEADEEHIVWSGSSSASDEDEEELRGGGGATRSGRYSSDEESEGIPKLQSGGVSSPRRTVAGAKLAKRKDIDKSDTQWVRKARSRRRAHALTRNSSTGGGSNLPNRLDSAAVGGGGVAPAGVNATTFCGGSKELVCATPKGLVCYRAGRGRNTGVADDATQTLGILTIPMVPLGASATAATDPQTPLIDDSNLPHVATISARSLRFWRRGVAAADTHNKNAGRLYLLQDRPKQTISLSSLRVRYERFLSSSKPPSVRTTPSTTNSTLSSVLASPLGVTEREFVRFNTRQNEITCFCADAGGRRIFLGYASGDIEEVGVRGGSCLNVRHLGDDQIVRMLAAGSQHHHNNSMEVAGATPLVRSNPTLASKQFEITFLAHTDTFKMLVAATGNGYVVFDSLPGLRPKPPAHRAKAAFASDALSSKTSSSSLSTRNASTRVWLKVVAAPSSTGSTESISCLSLSGTTSGYAFVGTTAGRVVVIDTYSPRLIFTEFDATMALNVFKTRAAPLTANTVDTSSSPSDFCFSPDSKTPAKDLLDGLNHNLKRFTESFHRTDTFSSSPTALRTRLESENGAGEDLSELALEGSDPPASVRDICLIPLFHQMRQQPSDSSTPLSTLAEVEVDDPPEDTEVFATLHKNGFVMFWTLSERLLNSAMGIDRATVRDQVVAAEVGERMVDSSSKTVKSTQPSTAHGGLFRGLVKDGSPLQQQQQRRGANNRSEGQNSQSTTHEAAASSQPGGLIYVADINYLIELARSNHEAKRTAATAAANERREAAQKKRLPRINGGGSRRPRSLSVSSHGAKSAASTALDTHCVEASDSGASNGTIHPTAMKYSSELRSLLVSDSAGFVSVIHVENFVALLRGLLTVGVSNCNTTESPRAARADIAKNARQSLSVIEGASRHAERPVSRGTSRACPGTTEPVPTEVTLTVATAPLQHQDVASSSRSPGPRQCHSLHPSTFMSMGATRISGVVPSAPSPRVPLSRLLGRPGASAIRTSNADTHRHSESDAPLGANPVVSQGTTPQATSLLGEMLPDHEKPPSDHPRHIDPFIADPKSATASLFSSYCSFARERSLRSFEQWAAVYLRGAPAFPPPALSATIPVPANPTSVLRGLHEALDLLMSRSQEEGELGLTTGLLSVGVSDAVSWGRVISLLEEVWGATFVVRALKAALRGIDDVAGSPEVHTPSNATSALATLPSIANLTRSDSIVVAPPSTATFSTQESSAFVLHSRAAVKIKRHTMALDAVVGAGTLTASSSLISSAIESYRAHAGEILALDVSSLCPPNHLVAAPTSLSGSSSSQAHTQAQEEGSVVDTRIEHILEDLTKSGGLTHLPPTEPENGDSHQGHGAKRRPSSSSNLNRRTSSSKPHAEDVGIATILDYNTTVSQTFIDMQPAHRSCCLFTVGTDHKARQWNLHVLDRSSLAVARTLASHRVGGIPAIDDRDPLARMEAACRYLLPIVEGSVDSKLSFQDAPSPHNSIAVEGTLVEGSSAGIDLRVSLGDNLSPDTPPPLTSATMERSLPTAITNTTDSAPKGAHPLSDDASKSPSPLRPGRGELGQFLSSHPMRVRTWSQHEESTRERAHVAGDNDPNALSGFSSSPTRVLKRRSQTHGPSVATRQPSLAFAPSTSTALHAEPSPPSLVHLASFLRSSSASTPDLCCMFRVALLFANAGAHVANAMTPSPLWQQMSAFVFQLLFDEERFKRSDGWDIPTRAGLCKVHPGGASSEDMLKFAGSLGGCSGGAANPLSSSITSASANTPHDSMGLSTTMPMQNNNPVAPGTAIGGLVAYRLSRPRVPMSARAPLINAAPAAVVQHQPQPPSSTAAPRRQPPSSAPGSTSLSSTAAQQLARRNNAQLVTLYSMTSRATQRDRKRERETNRLQRQARDMTLSFSCGRTPGNGSDFWGAESMFGGRPLQGEEECDSPLSATIAAVPNAQTETALTAAVSVPNRPFHSLRPVDGDGQPVPPEARAAVLTAVQKRIQQKLRKRRLRKLEGGRSSSSSSSSGIHDEGGDGEGREGAGSNLSRPSTSAEEGDPLEMDSESSNQAGHPQRLSGLQSRVGSLYPVGSTIEDACASPMFVAPPSLVDGKARTLNNRNSLAVSNNPSEELVPASSAAPADASPRRLSLLLEHSALLAASSPSTRRQNRRGGSCEAAAASMMWDEYYNSPRK